jgi:hypothetical protein
MHTYFVFTKDGKKCEIRDVYDIELKPEGDLWLWRKIEKDIDSINNTGIAAEAVAAFSAGSWDFFMRDDAGSVYGWEDQSGG